MALLTLILAKIGLVGVATIWAAKVALVWAGLRLWKRRNTKV